MSNYSYAVQKWSRKILIVEDDSFMSSLLSEILNSHSFITKVVDSAAVARSEIDNFDPDGVILDIDLGVGPTGLNLAHIINRTHPHVGIVFLSQFKNPKLLDPAFETFPDGSAFLVKSEVGNASRLLEIIDDVLSGSAAKAEVKDGTPLALLTKTQLEILKLVAMGYTNTSIAKIRRTQQRTVEQRIQDVYVTLGISDLEHINPRVEATRTYIQFAGLPLERNFEID